ncbi:MAG TPA: peptide chain release factor N(5)-glutamine methyltransferase [Candidatus Acidoferrales bacterium]|nr:peptide chain release factor N(5)-glutamine methyltransferase [Candidatus Acidoferrales bacterium]
MSEELLAFVTGKSAAYLRAHEGESLDDATRARYHELAARLEQGEPLAYVTGSAGFYGREFLVDRRVLIPRPETEHLIDAAIEHLRGRGAARVLDVGTGSGAIACTLAAELPRIRVDATDASPEALQVAIANRDRLKLQPRISFFLGDLLEPVAFKRYDVIVANLPYVPTGEGDASLRYEPVCAVDGGPDGLDNYRRFFERVAPLLNPDGLLLAEGAPPIADGLLALARAAFPQAAVTLERDYGGRERFVKVKTPG